MPMCVTEKMVDAAHRKLPGISNRVRVREALEAAAALAPDADLNVPVTARLHLQIDAEQLHRDAVTAIERIRDGYRTDTDGRLILASFDAAIPADESYITAEGLEGPSVTDATGQSGITVTEPRVYAGIAEIATHFQAGRSTVAGWVKNAATNGMPTPLAVLSAGPVYDLDAVEAWYRTWKGST